MLTVEEIKSAVAKIGKDYGIKNAYLFGSYATGDADEFSDVDLYVESGLRGLKFVGLVESIRNAINKDVDVLDSSHVDANSKIFDNIKNTGLLIYER